MNAPPEPLVSGRYFLPVAPLLWRNRMPACWVTSVNSTGVNLDGSTGATEGDGEAVDAGAVVFSVTGALGPVGCWVRQAVIPNEAAIETRMAKRRRGLIIRVLQ